MFKYVVFGAAIGPSVPSASVDIPLDQKVCRISVGSSAISIGANVPIFKLRLQKTYFNTGFFNVVVDYDRYVRKSSGPVRLRLGLSGIEIDGKINRTANNNGTARILGGESLRNWFQRNFEPMDTVDVDLSSQDIIILAGNDEAARQRNE